MARSSGFSRLLSSKTFLLINLLFLGFLIFSFSREFIQDYSIRQEIAKLEAEKAELENTNSDIAALMGIVQTETYIEREARIKLGLVKPGETVVILPETANGATVEEAATSSATLFGQDFSAIANPLKWWYYFFDINKFDMIKIYGK